MINRTEDHIDCRIEACMKTIVVRNWRLHLEFSPDTTNQRSTSACATVIKEHLSSYKSHVVLIFALFCTQVTYMLSSLVLIIN